MIPHTLIQQEKVKQMIDFKALMEGESINK